MESINDCITVNNLWKVFGSDPERVTTPEWHDKSRSEVQEETGCVVALKDVNFSVPEGDIFVVMGLSGSGKSTLIRCLIRLIEPTHGEIFIDDEDVLACNDNQLTQLRRTKVAMVFQRFGLFPHRTVMDNTVWGMELRGASREEQVDTHRRCWKWWGCRAGRTTTPGSSAVGCSSASA